MENHISHFDIECVFNLFLTYKLWNSIRQYSNKCVNCVYIRYKRVKPPRIPRVIFMITVGYYFYEVKINNYIFIHA